MLPVIHVLGSMLMMFSVTYVLPIATALIYADGHFVDFVVAAVACLALSMSSAAAAADEPCAALNTMPLAGARVTLAEAVANYADAAKVGVAHAMREIAEMRRQASSSLVIPQGGALPPGGPFGGGKIQMP